MANRHPLPVIRAAVWHGLVLAALALACSPRVVEPPSIETHEDSFAEQARAVRDGRSTQIRLDAAEVTDDDLNHLRGLEDKLRRINLSRTRVTDDGLKLLGTMHKLEQLRLSGPNISDAGLKAVAQLSGLRFLHLIDAPITDVGLDQLHSLDHLESLYLDGTRVTDEGLGRLVAAMPGVHLHIDDHHHRLDPHAADHSH